MSTQHDDILNPATVLMQLSDEDVESSSDCCSGITVEPVSTNSNIVTVDLNQNVQSATLVDSEEQDASELTMDQQGPTSSEETIKGKPSNGEKSVSALLVHSSNLMWFPDEDVGHLNPAENGAHFNSQMETCIKVEGEFSDSHTEDLYPNWRMGIPKRIVTNLDCLEKRRVNREIAKLPMLASKDEFVKRLKSERALVVTAETGSGKTTQLPQYCAEEFPGLVICTQPRVIAAISVAQRIAKEFDDAPVGGNVGYETKSGNKVRGRQIMIMTDAALIRLAQRDHLLEHVGVLIIDEAHERSLNTDIVVGIAKTIITQRPDDFKVVIASATIDPQPFLDFFFDDRFDLMPSLPLTVPGRVFPVTTETRHFGKTDDFSAALANEVVKTLKKHKVGHCLIFLQGAREVDRALTCFEKLAQPNWVALPLYGTLSLEEQNKVLTFDDNGGTLRMIVFCTNVAETSLTVPNVRLVIDTGLAKEARYDAERRMTILEEVYISQSSANQRKGRAGRTVEGHCIQLFAWETLIRKNIEPEILRSSLDLVMLQVCSLGFNPLKFSFITRPEEALMHSSLKMLTEMACLTASFTLTERGRLFNNLPLDPRLSNFVLLAHEEFGEGDMAAEIAAILSAPGSIFFLKNSKDTCRKQEMRDFNGFSSDLLLLQSIYKKWLVAGDVDSFNCCRSCHKIISNHVVAMEGGCRSCRAKFSRMDSLNNKTLNIVRGTVTQVRKVIDRRIVGSSTNLSTRFLIENTEQAIGICLAQSFPEQVCEFIMPSNPTVGAYSIISELKGQLSFSSILRVAHPGSKYLIPMSLTRIPSGLLLMNQAHHVVLEWLPPAAKQRVEAQSLNTTECYKKENVSGRYCAPCRKYFQRLFDEGEQFAGFVVCQYNVSTTTLVVFSPRTNKAEVAAICDALVKSSIEEDLAQEMVITTFNESATLTVTAGFNIKEIKVEKQQPCRVHFINPPAKTGKELLQWVCKIADCKESGIKWHTLQTSRDPEMQNGSSTIGIVMFVKEEVAKKAQKNYASTDFSFEHGCYRTIVKSSHSNVEALLHTHNVYPTKVLTLREGGFQINFVSLPESMNDDHLRLLFRRYNLPNPSFIKTTRPVNGTIKAFVTFKVNNDESKDIISKCHSISELNSRFAITVPDKRSMNLYGTPATRQITVTTKYSEKVELAEYIVSFRTCQEADALYMLAKRTLQFEVDGTATMIVRHPKVFSLEEHLDKIASIYSVKHKMGKTFPKGGQEIRFNGNLTSVCDKAVQEFRKLIAPIKFSFETRDKHLMGQELLTNKKLQLWAEELVVNVEEHWVREHFSGINIHGEKYQQGQFMAKLANYYDEFSRRYHLMALSPSANCLFRKGNPGEIELKKFVEEKKSTEVQISYQSFLSSIEIAIIPNSRRPPSVIIKECMSAINGILSKFNEKSSEARNCVYCNVHPGRKFSICGHSYCKECLQQVVQMELSTVSISKYMTNAEARKLENKLKSDIGCCPACNTEISIKDLWHSLNRSIMEEACMAFAQLLLRRVDHKLGVCPMTLCGSFIPKQAGYSSCPSCKQFVCPKCGVANDCMHHGVTCEEYQQLLKCGKDVESLGKIIKNAEQYVHSHWQCNVMNKVINKIDINPGLVRGCMALQRYCTGIQRVGINEFEKQAVFAWHGTSDAVIPAICDDGFDPKTRSGQAYGPGEYFGTHASISLGYNKGCERLIVVQLIQGVFVKKQENFCYVVNNPTDWSYAFNLPVLVVTYGLSNQAQISWILQERRLLPYPFDGLPLHEESPVYADSHCSSHSSLVQTGEKRSSHLASTSAYNLRIPAPATIRSVRQSVNHPSNVHRSFNGLPLHKESPVYADSHCSSHSSRVGTGEKRSSHLASISAYNLRIPAPATIRPVRQSVNHPSNVHRSFNGLPLHKESPVYADSHCSSHSSRVGTGEKRSSHLASTAAYNLGIPATIRPVRQSVNHPSNVHRGSSFSTAAAGKNANSKKADNSCIII